MTSAQPVVLFLVGPPGAGKTAAARALLDRVDGGGWPKRFMIPKPKWTVVPSAPVHAGGSLLLLAGHYDGTTFEGADTVPYNGVAAALDWWAIRADVPALTVFDGDRFSNGSVKAFFEARAGVLTLCAHLSTQDPAETVRRREARSAAQQNPSWVKGRETKAARFAATFDDARRTAFFTDGRTPDAVAADLAVWAGTLAAS